MTDHLLGRQDLLPARFSAPIAARLLRTTTETLASPTNTGAIHAEPPGGRRYNREELERLLGRRVTLVDWLDAESAEIPRREAQRRYNAKRREVRSPSAGPVRAHR